MLDEKERGKIALRKFSLIAPVLNGQTENQKECFKKMAAEPVDMPHYGLKRYTIKTFDWWLYLYRRHGLEGLKPGYRSDRGKSRRVTEEIAFKIQEKKTAKPQLSGILLYEELVKDGVFKPDKLSPATFYRFLAQNPNLANIQDTGKEEKEIKRFSHQKVNQLWQTDILYGPYLKLGRVKKRTYLIAYIDDASRLVAHGRFNWEQNFVTIRDVFKEAVLRRGIPKLLYTGNGKVYRCGQLAFICASLGCGLLHAEPFSPNEKGKIERFFRTVRMRFLSRLEPEKIKSLEELNLRFWEWLEEDCQRKAHSSLQMSPLDYFMSRADEVNMFPDPALLNEYFLVRVFRKINHDATLSLENVLYETDQKLANTRLEVRYEPQWLNNPARPVILYRDGAKVGEARQVNLLENASAKRKGRGRPAKQYEPEDTPPVQKKGESTEPAVSFSAIFETDTPGEAGEV